LMPRSLITRPQGYDEFLRDLKQRIRTAQVKAVFAVNRELILLYWQIGHGILERQHEAGWGAKVIERLAADLHREFPGTTGFSRTNLLYMRAFAAAWPEEPFVQQVVGHIPWGHNLRILDLVKSPQERQWYIRQAIEHGWSRNVLSIKLKADSTVGKERHRRISKPHCQRHNRNSRNRRSKTRTTSIFLPSQRMRERSNWKRACWNTSANFSLSLASALHS
jgi:predicted nuclease of restriction endonuclease-like (RecB) superfamily